MKRVLLITIAAISIFTSCQKENKNTTQETAMYKATETTVEGSYESAILGYEVFKVKLDMDKSALVTKAKAKDNAVTSLGTWELNDRTIKVVTNKSTEYFYATPKGIVFIPNATTIPNEKLQQENLLNKQ